MDIMKIFARFSCIAAIAVLIAGQGLPGEPQRRSTAVDFLIQKAHSLEARDRLDLAAQVWQQVLVANPNQPDALAGLARSAKRTGKSEEANAYLDKLRRVRPDAPALTELDMPDSVRTSGRRLEQAGKLAGSGHPDEAMLIYRELFGATPPPGSLALAYYETLASTQGGFEPAVAALRKLADSYPGVPSYRLAAGRLMTYRPETRQSGVALLSSIPASSSAASKAREAWRQALLWEKENPAYAASLEAYLSRYPDSGLQEASATLRSKMGKPEWQNSETREEQLGYLALKNGDVGDAERRFQAALAKDDRSGRAYAGLGFVSMKAGDFDGAVKHFEAAQKLTPHDATVRSSLESARFWQAMRMGAKSADSNDWTDAVSHYQAALAIRPDSSEALTALGGALVAAGTPEKALSYLDRAVHSKGAEEGSWLAFVTAKMQVEGGKAALAAMEAVPSTIASRLKRKAGWRAVEALAWSDAGEEARARDIYRDLVAADTAGLTSAEEIQVASLALRFRQAEQALPHARRAVDGAENNAAAWEVLLAALVGSGRPQEAQRVYERMPEKIGTIARLRPSFCETLASLKEANGDLEGARAFLEQATSLTGGSHAEAALISAKLYLAQVLAKLGRGTEAETMVTDVLDTNANNLDAWRVRFLVLQTLGQHNEIVSFAARMPQAVAVRLGTEGDMVSLLARAQGKAGDPALGVRLLETYINRQHAGDSSDALAQRIQLAWLLLEFPGESGRLFSVLESLNGRADLNSDQRKEVAGAWTTWIARSAEAARRNKDEARAIALLERGLSMFPDNSDLERALAGDLLASGNTKRAFNVYSNWGLRGAQADDYAGAIGAALAERNAQYADVWIEEALTSWPNHPKLLELAGERAKMRGDLKKAELYWRQALAERNTQAKDSLLVAEDRGPSLKALLVGPEGRRASAFGDSNAPVQEAHGLFASSADHSSFSVHLSSFPRREAAREEFVRGKAVLPETAVASAPAWQMAQFNAVLPTAAPVDSLEDKIASLDSRNTPYLGTRMSVWGRGGEAGFGRLLIEQSEFEASTTLANALRASLLLKPTYLSGGTASGSGESLFGRQTSAASFGPQTASGLAAEAQLSSQSVGIRLGMTPQGFLTHNWVGGLRLQPKNGPITILLERDSIKDTMLAYAGARDPQSGQTWGGVMANGASLQGQWGDGRSGFYAGGGYQTLEGRNVARNTGVRGNVGTWWKIAVLPTGSLTAGMNFSAMHYERNLRYFTYGQGGYFSPQQYFLFNAPVRWTGSYGQRLQYELAGSLGLQHFVEDASEYYPNDAALQAKTGYRYPATTVTGASFNFDTRVFYQMAPHWILGAFAESSNARNYTASSAGLFVKYTFEERPMSLENALPSVPDWRGQQPFQMY
jgi:Flp pilus assembly protein TadD